MRACIHRGSKQIGGSCVEVANCGQRLLIDFGLPLDAEENNSQYLPKIAGLDGSDRSLLGVLISHPHIDHFGLLAHISPSIMVGMGAAARRILEAAAPFLLVFRPPEGDLSKTRGRAGLGFRSARRPSRRAWSCQGRGSSAARGHRIHQAAPRFAWDEQRPRSS